MMSGSAAIGAAIVGLAGTKLAPDERTLLAETPPLGVILFKRNIAGAAQLTDLMAEISDIIPNCLMMVDQEGGRVARLRPPHWLAHPTAAFLGALFDQDEIVGRRAAYLTGALIGLDCAGAGFNVACAPVLDLAVAGADPVIGDRAFHTRPGVVTILASEVAHGMLAAGVQPVGKHVPGHGRAAVDSHLALPELDDVDDDDLAPFRALAWLPWMMTAHIRYRRLDPQPATLSRAVLQTVVRERLAYRNLLISDDLSMHAVSGDPGGLALRALAAGCDVALHCSGVPAETRAVLQAVPAPDAAAQRRLAAATQLAAERRQTLDAQAMQKERAALLA